MSGRMRSSMSSSSSMFRTDGREKSACGQWIVTPQERSRSVKRPSRAIALRLRPRTTIAAKPNAAKRLLPPQAPFNFIATSSPGVRFRHDTVPPHASTHVRTIASPNPAPPVSRVRAASGR
jgi:hypothetical protein